ncbi:hypothetical protein [Verrucomicrobium sp. BvORR034]|uniref:hypothetical protein n=1 Tax=Verrucomicrobium sp. BvORR034 TaxID=1396418 RepID=UPI000679942C|nr:hypothetical protein [Verrucomicrobium sp. BvORR034]
MKKILLQIYFLIVAGALQAQEEKRTVDLKFDWPNGLSLNVDRVFERNTSIGNKNEHLTSRSQYTWRLERIGETCHVRFNDYREITKEDAPKFKDPLVQLEYISRQVEPILPDIVLNSNAQPIGLENLEFVKAHVAKEIGAIRGSQDPMFQQFVKILTNEQTLQVRALEDWNRMVQVWSGNVGAELGGSSVQSGPTGHTAGTPVENLFVYRVDAGPKPGTVKLTVVQKPKKEEIKKVLDGMLGADVTEILQLQAGDELVVENRFTTICDPSNLIPETYEKVKIWGAYIGADRTFRGRKDTWTHTFVRAQSK